MSPQYISSIEKHSLDVNIKIKDKIIIFNIFRPWDVNRSKSNTDVMFQKQGDHLDVDLKYKFSQSSQKSGQIRPNIAQFFDTINFTELGPWWMLQRFENLVNYLTKMFLFGHKSE